MQLLDHFDIDDSEIDHGRGQAALQVALLNTQKSKARHFVQVAKQSKCFIAKPLTMHGHLIFERWTLVLTLLALVVALAASSFFKHKYQENNSQKYECFHLERWSEICIIPFIAEFLFLLFIIFY